MGAVRAVSDDISSRLFLFGANHSSAGAAFRGQLLNDEVECEALLREVRAAGIDQALVLATCDRLEFLGLRGIDDAYLPALTAIVAKQARAEVDEITGQTYCHIGAAALRHLFAVASSLDSQVVGEPQVLGQLKDSHRRAQAAGMLGAQLESILQAAYGAAKRVRSETALAEHPVSMAAAALMVARSLHGELGRCSGLLLGLGEMGDLLALELRDAGLAHLVVMHASPARAEATAHRLNCHFQPMEELEASLAGADIVVSALGSGRCAVTERMVAAVLKRRRNRPILFLDTALPGDVDPAVGALDNAFLYSLDDLEGVTRAGKADRDEILQAAWSIVDEELGRFLTRQAERSAVPAVTALRGHFEAVRQSVLSEGRQDPETATRRLLARLLHDPSEVLRAVAASDPAAAAEWERAVRRLFRLEAETAVEQKPREEEENQ